MADRRIWANAAEYKAHYYQQSDCRLLIESNPKQAERIHQLTGRPVIAFETNEAFGVIE